MRRVQALLAVFLVFMVEILPKLQHRHRELSLPKYTCSHTYAWETANEVQGTTK